MLIISSFNIRCFGLGGEYSGRFRDEQRHYDLKNMIHKKLSKSDVMIFQEIVDVESFKMIIPNNFTLYEYSHDYKRHQRVVIAVKNTHLVLKKEIVPHVTIDEKFSRPALHLKIQLESTLVVNVIGVHLKSGDLHTDTRLQQVRAITDYIKLINSSDPYIIGGDFNTHKIESSDLEFDDTKYLSDVFKTAGLEHMGNDIPTFQTNWSKNILDHFWVSKKLIKDASLEVSSAAKKAVSLDDYYKKISDHVPVILNIRDFD